MIYQVSKLWNYDEGGWGWFRCFCSSIESFTVSLHSPTWWRHQMETFSALLAVCAGNSPVHCELPTQRPVTRSFDVYFDLRPNKRLSKQLWGWWFETASCPLWCHRNKQQAFTCHQVCARGLSVAFAKWWKSPPVTWADNAIPKCI